MDNKCVFGAGLARLSSSFALALLILFSLGSLQSVKASQSNLTVTIKNIKNGNGQILVCLFNSGSGFPSCGGDGGAFKRFGTKARKGSITFTLNQIPDGVYAISTAHDQNGDNKIDRHFLFGYPTEGAGTSNYVKAPRSKPEFNKARFQLGGGRGAVEIIMHYP